MRLTWWIPGSAFLRFRMANGWGFAMGSPVPLRDDFDAAALRLLARRTRDANQGRRLLALAAVYDGGARAEAARIGSVGLQTVGDRVLRFNAAGPRRRQGAGAGAEAQRCPATGARPDCRERADPGGSRGRSLAADRSRAVDLGGVRGLDRQASRERRAMGLRKLSARPRHDAQNEPAAAAFKKSSPPSWRTSRAARPRAHG